MFWCNFLCKMGMGELGYKRNENSSWTAFPLACVYALSLPVRPDLVTAVSIPVVLVAVVLGVKRLRRMIGLDRPE